jgi:pimeloyl-ACP methyl ester carboxylesterase/membrane protein DedA with SNARE-associated domain
MNFNEHQRRTSRPRSQRRWRWRILIVYLVLLLASTVVRFVRTKEIAIPSDVKTVAVQEINGDKKKETKIRLAYREYLSEKENPKGTIILIHGSPGEARDFRKFAPLLAQDSYRVLALDLPGFAYSTRNISDYSFRAHAHYVLEFMDELKIERAHLLGFSMGGGVVLDMYDIAPQRVESITMLSAIGVQEMELFGEYYLNHIAHGSQLVFFWFLQNLAPPFNLLLDEQAISFSRNFYDSDQRSLRAILNRYDKPMLIIHGRQDPLVPVEAAFEHHRIVPQSEIFRNDESHFMVFEKPEIPANAMKKFLARVESGQARTRATADTTRIEQAAQPFNPNSVPKAIGVTAFVFFCLLALATLVSEDLTCISAGVMAAQGRIDFTLAVAACLFGIVVGDILLFLAGRFFGRPALKYAPLRWFVRDADVERSSRWFQKRGAAVIAISRFVPGMRLPTYFASGILRTSLLWFSLYFLVAASVWTPLLVFFSMKLGANAVNMMLGNQNFWITILLSAVTIYVLVRFLVSLATFRGRRLLIGRLKRVRHWEFWKMWMFYPPVVVYVIWLTMKRRSITVFTCANPAILASGFIGESKSEILNGLMKSQIGRESVPRFVLLEEEERINMAKSFASQVGFPVVCKPDVGERGAGVSVVRNENELENYLTSNEDNVIVQEYASGLEFGVFYYRYPNEERGHIFAITDKRFPSVKGDGKHTLEELILKDERAVCMARVYFDNHGENLWSVPEKNEEVKLIEIGTHCRGAIFLDGIAYKTDELENAIDNLCKGFDGFYFGRFDLRVPSIEDFKAGKNLRVIELNGVTSEATSIYDPKNSLFDAYRILFNQWRIAFEIGAQNKKRGVKPTTLFDLARLLFSKKGGIKVEQKEIKEMEAIP